MILNVANLYGADIEESNPRVRFGGGGFINLGLSDAFAIQLEVLYSQKGATWNLPFYYQHMEAAVILDYIEIPFLFQVMWSSPYKINGNLSIGPYVAKNIVAKVRGEVYGVFAEEDIENIKGTDFGAIFGAGLDFALGQGKGIFDARYALGLTTVDAEGSDVKNGVFSIMLGYAF